MRQRCRANLACYRRYPAALSLEAEARAAGKAAVDPKAQRNFTDPESRIMRKSGKDYVQAYNAQAAVDSTAQSSWRRA